MTEEATHLRVCRIKEKVSQVEMYPFKSCYIDPLCKGMFSSV